MQCMFHEVITFLQLLNFYLFVSPSMLVSTLVSSLRKHPYKCKPKTNKESTWNYYITSKLICMSSLKWDGMNDVIANQIHALTAWVKGFSSHVSQAKVEFIFI